jgi:hypothetical protein
MGSLLAELRRRNVFRVAAAYAMVGWVVKCAGASGAAADAGAVTPLRDHRCVGANAERRWRRR